MRSNVRERDRPLVNDRFFTIEEAAHHLGSVGLGVIYRLVSSGQLGSVRVGRRIMIPESDLDTYLSRTYRPAN